MGWRGWRSCAGTYLASFFLAVAAAPHHHVNDLEDLLLDQRSDSGNVVQTLRPVDASTGAVLVGARVIRDVPCLACFLGDFVCAPADLLIFVCGLTTLPLLPSLLDAARPELLAAETSSRSPPRFL